MQGFCHGPGWSRTTARRIMSGGLGGWLALERGSWVGSVRLERVAPGGLGTRLGTTS